MNNLISKNPRKSPYSDREQNEEFVIHWFNDICSYLNHKFSKIFYLRFSETEAIKGLIQWKKIEDIDIRYEISKLEESQYERLRQILTTFTDHETTLDLSKMKNDKDIIGPRKFDSQDEILRYIEDIKANLDDSIEINLI
ncbi:hypothetical protein DSAG12_01216 [Promethearchaeum syntrophicum]|uniref:Uncharacterized protein n=1 Tax=Promethearchaeum syntrophicum TaxID=2594042 RepID=A0A5B9D8Q4_9ARCH|nr:hypothetical protein [Candidatus Prometheoarchaeum syntrophicum]QEE15391.1 hypothetical protein DSAG12_01216 [Candidatus Prometheoarchaeum syntrophicum]